MTHAQLKGHHVALPGGRSVWMGVTSGRSVIVVWSRPGTDGTPHETAVSMSPEAFGAMMALGIQLLESGEMAQSEIALAVPKEETP